MEPSIVNHFERQSAEETDPHDDQVQLPKTIRYLVHEPIEHHRTGDILQSTHNVKEGDLELLRTIFSGDEVEQEHCAQHYREKVVGATVVRAEIRLIEDVDEIAHEQDVDDDSDQSPEGKYTGHQCHRQSSGDWKGM